MTGGDPRQTGLWPNALVYRPARTTGSPPHTAPLSLHATFRGREVYETSRSRHAMEPGAYLLLDAGRQVETAVAPGASVESLSVLFEEGFAARVLGSLVTPLDRLLDGATPDGPVAFVEKTYRFDDAASGGPAVGAALHALRDRARLGGLEPGEVEEAHHRLLGLLLEARRGLRREIDRVGALRASTRAEAYRRLARARDYLEASYDGRVTLADAARVAGIAPHRFLRLFKQAFGRTPHQWLTAARLRAARALVLETDRPVTEVCLAVGFTSLGSFSDLFRRTFGDSPSRLRARRVDSGARPSSS